MAAQGVQLIPSPEEIMQILKRTGAFREGHFIYPNGKHTAHYFQMPLAFRYYDTARVLVVACGRRSREARPWHPISLDRFSPWVCRSCRVTV